MYERRVVRGNTYAQNTQTGLDYFANASFKN